MNISSTSNIAQKVSTQSSLEINKAISIMSEEELVNIISTIGEEEEVNILQKCDQESLNKIFKTKRENVDKIVLTKTEGIDEIKEIENGGENDETVCALVNQMKIKLVELRDDNNRCETDIVILSQCLQKLKENIFMNKDDMDDESINICNDKLEETEGLIRLRYKTMENNTYSINMMESIVCMSENMI